MGQGKEGIRMCHNGLLYAAQKLIYTGFSPGFRVHLFHDDGTIKTIFAIRRRKVARDNDRSRRNSPIADLTRFTIVNLSALADVYPHGNNRVLADYDPLDNLGARADKAVVLDDCWICLDGFEHAAYSHAARK